MKTWEEKSHKLLSKTENQKTRLKAPQRVAEKNFSGPTHDTSISHLDPMIFNCHHIRKFFRMKWNGENWTIQNITWLAYERSTLSVQNLSGNTGDPNIIAYLYKIIINQSIIRCITLIRPLIKIKDKCINEIEIKMRMYSMLQLPAGKCW